MFWLIAFLVFVLTLHFGIKAYIYGNDDFWPTQGVLFGEGKELGTFFERISFRRPFHELDSVFYKKFKKLNPCPKLIGIMEFRRPIAMILDPDLIKNIMVKDFDHFTNRRIFGKKDDPTLFDKMLFNINGPAWKDLRSTLSPTFTTGKMKRMFEVFGESAAKMSTFLKTETKKNSEIDFRDVAGRYTMDVIASSAFGVDSRNFQDKNSIFAKMGHRLQARFSGWIGLFRTLVSIMLPSLFALLPISVMDPTAFGFFQDVVKKTIKYRKETGEKRNDLLQLLIESRSESETLETNDSDPDSSLADIQQKTDSSFVLTDEFIQAQCMMFFFAGLDPIETLLIFTAYELAINPEVQKKLSDELKTAIEKNGGLTYEVVNELEYLDMVISETLRKYPAASRAERRCNKEYLVPDTDIRILKDQVVAIPIWAIHNDPELYPDPEKYLPERFTKENKAARNPYTYIPFGMGPRNCIAMRFAILEGKASVAHLVHNFVIEPTARTSIPMKYQLGGTVKPAHGMWLKVTPK